MFRFPFVRFPAILIGNATVGNPKSSSHGILVAMAVSVFAAAPTASAEFAFGIHPENNSTADVAALEEEYGVRPTAVGYIFDGFSPTDAISLREAVETLGKDRVYHVTVSPLGLSAAEIANGRFDDDYSRFFETAKETGAKFVFRTMHEMNGSWYSWSEDPQSFKKAWIRIRGLSREAGLDGSNVLFSFSVNSEDLPSVDGKIGGEMKFCTPEVRKKTGCLAFEDYYPGAAYVDLVGISVYNSGRARSEGWSRWRTFAQLLDDKRMDVYRRMKALGKPIFIDETATTAVNFEGEWSNAKVLDRYRNSLDDKNAWISGMAATVAARPEIVGALYFNRDRTRGLTDRSVPGELDWAALPPESAKTYRAILEIFATQSVGNRSMPFAKPSEDPAFMKGKAAAEALIRKIDRATGGDSESRRKKCEQAVRILTEKLPSVRNPRTQAFLTGALESFRKAVYASDSRK